MQKILFFFFAAIAVVSGASTPVKNCKGVSESLFKKVVVSTPKGVCTKTPCELISGKDVKTEITFEVKKEVKEITLKCNATAGGLTIQYPIPNATKGCDMLTNTFCPIEPDTEAELLLKMNVLKIFPKVPVDLVFYLLDQSQRMISCFEVATKVVADKYINDESSPDLIVVNNSE